MKINTRTQIMALRLIGTLIGSTPSCIRLPSAYFDSLLVTTDRFSALTPSMWELFASPRQQKSGRRRSKAI